MTDSLDTSDREAEDPREPIRLDTCQHADQVVELPPLPYPAMGRNSKGVEIFTADQMQSYARAAKLESMQLLRAAVAKRSKSRNAKNWVTLTVHVDLMSAIDAAMSTTKEAM